MHDNRGGQSQDDDLQLPMGDGTVDFRAIMTSLIKTGYDGTVTLGVKPEFQEASPNGDYKTRVLIKQSKT